MYMGVNMVEFTEENFEEQVLRSDQPVLVDFWAEWCAPCHVIAPAVEEVAMQFKNEIVVGKVNVDHHPKIAIRYGIRSIPSLLLFKNGEVSRQAVGTIPTAAIADMVEQVI
jgi:thioredoxin 1